MKREGVVLPCTFDEEAKQRRLLQQEDVPLVEIEHRIRFAIGDDGTLGDDLVREVLDGIEEIHFGEETRKRRAKPVAAEFPVERPLAFDENCFHAASGQQIAEDGTGRTSTDYHHVRRLLGSFGSFYSFRLIGFGGIHRLVGHRCGPTDATISTRPVSGNRRTWTGRDCCEGEAIIGCGFQKRRQKLSGTV